MYRARVFVRFQDDPVATIERVTAGWQLAVNDPESATRSTLADASPNVAMIFGASAGLVVITAEARGR